MDELIKAVQKTYENSTRVRFLSDENGNILWKSGKDTDEEITIIFPDGVPYNKDEEKYATVLINGQSCAVSGSVLSTEKKGAILWTVHSLTEVLNELGTTDTYIETCYMISDAKRNIDRILAQNDVVVKNDPDKSESEHIRSQNIACYNLLKQIESFQELITVIYRRSVNNSTINIVDLLNEVCCEANRQLEDTSVRVTLTHKGVDCNNATIKANKYYLFLCLVSILKKLIECSRDQQHTLDIRYNGDCFIISFAFDHDMTHYIDALSGDFSIYCAKMYINYLGGKVTERKNHLLVSIPFYKVTAFHSTRAEYNHKPNQYKKLAKIFLCGIEPKDEN